MAIEYSGSCGRSSDVVRSRDMSSDHVTHIVRDHVVPPGSRDLKIWRGQPKCYCGPNNMNIRGQRLLHTTSFVISSL